jgi:hypothetical protein
VSVSPADVPAFWSLLEVPREAEPRRLEPQKPGPAARDSAEAGGDEFARLQERFKELGAQHYRLEAWNGDRPLYRFRCEMPALNRVPGRVFQAEAETATEAMTSVLEQMEAAVAKMPASPSTRRGIPGTR